MATIAVMFGPDNLGAHKMTHSPFTVGRDAACGVTIDNAGVSRFHCKFIWDGKHFFLEDMESANGTFHHGHKIRKVSIADGDKVQIGKFELIFKHGKDEAPPSIKEEWSPEGGTSEKALGSDPMLTFKMDGREIQQQMNEMKSRSAAGPQRASEIARSFKPSKTGVGPRAKGSLLGRLVKFIVVLGLIGVVALAVLASLDSLEVIDVKW